MPIGLTLTKDGLLACSFHEPSTLYKFALNDSMDELATVPALADYGQGFARCAVHQQTQRTYALRETDEGDHALVLFDANLQAIGTVEATGDVPEDANAAADYEPIRDVAVHGDQVIVLTSGIGGHTKGSGLRLLDLDGRFLRTIAAGQFHHPQAVAASHGRAFVIDDDGDDSRATPGQLELQGNMLHIIDIQSGDTVQRVPVDLQGEASEILVDGDEIYIADHSYSRVVVLQLAGSVA